MQQASSVWTRTGVVLRKIARRVLKRFVPHVPLLARRSRLETWSSWLQPYEDNPFKIDPEQTSSSRYEEIAAEVLSKDSSDFKNQVLTDFGYLPPDDFIEGLAKRTQFVIRDQFLYEVHIHGYLLYAALRRSLAERDLLPSFTILETGTARGFSSLCMAKALHDGQRAGKILTVDVLPSRVPIYWNCISDVSGKKTRFELLEDYGELVSEHIIYLQGHSEIVLRQLGMQRVHFAFVDAAHTYEGVKAELSFLLDCQKAGDVILLDDYTPDVFPGVVQAVDEFLKSEPYSGRLYRSDGGRGYMHCVRLG